MTSLPNCKKPCKDCPFRLDCTPGWLGADRMTEILNSKSFTCHKTNKTLQCAGHMIIKGKQNDFVKLAKRLNIPLELTGHKLIFKTETELIKHHTF